MIVTTRHWLSFARDKSSRLSAQPTSKNRWNRTRFASPLPRRALRHATEVGHGGCLQLDDTVSCVRNPKDERARPDQPAPRDLREGGSHVHAVAVITGKPDLAREFAAELVEIGTAAKDDDTVARGEGLSPLGGNSTRPSVPLHRDHDHAGEAADVGVA